MQMLERIHGGYVHRRRVRVLANHIARLVSPGAKLLDVGGGDGLLAHEIRQRRPDLMVTGIDVLVRPKTHVPVEPFNGRCIPYDDGAFDSVLFVDVLHHAEDPMQLLREAARVARSEVILKDHTMDTRLSGPILRFMDRVGNERHGVNIVYNYWSTARWRTAFADVRLEITEWADNPALYPWPASLVFGRGLHFIAKLRPRGSVSAMPAALPAKTKRTFIRGQPVTSSTQTWESAYRRFETPAEEVAKFVKRLGSLGAHGWPRTARIVELFCGRGSGLEALAKLGFVDLAGIDVSPRLVALYRGPAKVVVGDCRALPWADGSKDVLIVQGGLHHLPDPAQDLDQVLAESRRVLAPGGRFMAVEPWLTPFLQGVHAASFSPLRRLSAKLDAFATMTEHERETYEKWLVAPTLIRSLFEKHFQVEHLYYSWGKIRFVGIKRP